MGLFDKFFGTSTQKQTKRIIENTVKETQRSSGPLYEIGKAVIHAAYTCSNGIKPLIHAGDKSKSLEIEMYIFSEFVYFFLHMTNRAGHTRLTPHQFEKLHDYLGVMVVPVAIDSFMNDWPENIKQGIRSEFFVNINKAEIEYSVSKEIISQDKPFSGDSLMSKLARNIALQMGSEHNPEILVRVHELGMGALRDADFVRLISNLAKVL